MKSRIPVSRNGKNAGSVGSGLRANTRCPMASLSRRAFRVGSGSPRWCSFFFSTSPTQKVASFRQGPRAILSIFVTSTSREGSCPGESSLSVFGSDLLCISNPCSPTWMRSSPNNDCTPIRACCGGSRIPLWAWTARKSFIAPKDAPFPESGRVRGEDSSIAGCVDGGARRVLGLGSKGSGAEGLRESPLPHSPPTTEALKTIGKLEVSYLLEKRNPDVDAFLRTAIDEARTGLAEGGIPIGSVLVIDGKI